jgi:hypothetical protein
MGMDVDAPSPSATMTTTTTDPFPFLKLPTELRLQVYEALLFDPSSYIIPIANIRPAHPDHSKKLYAAILGTSRQIYAEAVPVLYSYNTFMIRTFPLQVCLPELTEYFGKENAGLIKRVFTVNRFAGLEGAAVTEVTEEQVREKYAGLGVKWEGLQTWAVKMTEEEVADRWVRESGGWLERVTTQRMKELGLNAVSSTVGNNSYIGEDRWLTQSLVVVGFRRRPDRALGRQEGECGEGLGMIYPCWSHGESFASG